jgi:DNA-binding NarL/FixJ family response regulator
VRVIAMEAPSQAELLARTRRAHDSLRQWQLVLGTTHRPYANLLLLCLTLPESVAPLKPQRLLGIADSAAALLACLPEDGSDVLVAVEDTLRDGSVLPLLQQLRQRPSPPIVLLTLDAPAAQAAWVQAAWRTGVEALVRADHFGQGVLAEALQALERGERYCDPGIRALLTPAGPAADGLSRRELEVLPLLAEGLTNRQIAARLQIAEVTARDHVQRILQKLQVPDRAAAAAWAVRLGLVR